LLPQFELDERRQTAEQLLRWIRQYCESEPVDKTPESRLTPDERLSEVARIFGEGARLLLKKRNADDLSVSSGLVD
jgi:hypothetical protein